MSNQPGGWLMSQCRTDGTDQSALFNAELAQLQANGGGTYGLPTGTVRLDPQITFPHDTSSPFWKASSIRILGVGARQGGALTAGLETQPGGTVLDLRYGGSTAKMLALARGLLEFDGVTFNNGAMDQIPFLLATNTTVKMRNCTFIGRNVDYGASCAQDAIILGGVHSPVVYDNTVGAGFQGYGSSFDGVRFSRIQRGFYLRTSANSVSIDNCVWGIECGGQTAMEFDGTIDQSRGNFGTNNLIEMMNYTYGMTFRNAGWNSFFGTAFWDAGGGTVAELRIVGNSYGVELHGTFGCSTVENLDGCAYVVTGNAILQGTLVQNRILGRGIEASGGGAGQDVILQINRSYAEAVAPNTAVFKVNDKGALTLIAPTGQVPQVILTSPASGGLTLDHQTVLRDSGHLLLYAGTGASDQVRVMRGALGLSSFTTATRPAPNGRAGLAIFDSTLGRPVWSNSAGNGWVDATGASV